MTQDPFFTALGIDPKVDGEKLCEAYDRAHDIRKFEIEMYWRRSAYLWTLQTAALGGLALILTTTNALTWHCPPIDSPAACNAVRTKFIVVLAIWCFGTFSAYIWLLLLRGAKFWQNNWERHVDYLENYFSGALYKTYPVDKFEPPYSVSKLNELMALFTLFVWITIGLSVGIIVLNANTWILVVVPGLAVLLFLSWLFDCCLRMTNFGYQTTKAPSSEDKTTMIVSRMRPQTADTR